MYKMKRIESNSLAIWASFLFSVMNSTKAKFSDYT